MGFDLLFGIFPIFFVIAFSIFLLIFVSVFIKSLKRSRYNHAAPQLSVKAKLVGRRTSITHHPDFMSSTRYYLTFEVESGDRLEFETSGELYGMSIEGDFGKLTFKGTELIDFIRE